MLLLFLLAALSSHPCVWRPAPLPVPTAAGAPGMQQRPAHP